MNIIYILIAYKNIIMNVIQAYSSLINIPHLKKKDVIILLES